MKTFFGTFVLQAEDEDSAREVLDVFEEECGKAGWSFDYALKEQR